MPDQRLTVAIGANLGRDWAIYHRQLRRSVRHAAR
jgi:hypothetical protein